MATLTMKYGIISADDHLQEAPDVWTKRMSKAKFGDDIPHIVELPDGSQTWALGGSAKGFGGLARIGGINPKVRTWDQVPRSTYVASERLEILDQEELDASVDIRVNGVAPSATVTNLRTAPSLAGQNEATEGVLGGRRSPSPANNILELNKCARRPRGYVRAAGIVSVKNYDRGRDSHGRRMRGHDFQQRIISIPSASPRLLCSLRDSSK